MLPIFLALAGLVSLVVAGALLHPSVALAILGLACLHGARSTIPERSP